MKKITFQELSEKNFCLKKISNYKLESPQCIKCNKPFEYSAVKKFLRNRIDKKDKFDLWETCSKCWHSINTSEDKIWLENNARMQLVIQNLPEQRRKNAEGVSKSWNKERRKRASDFLREKWRNDPDTMRKSFKSGGLKGVYNGIDYDSALELSYILWCFDNNIKIERYNLPPIEYKDENNIDRLYFPDFIISDSTIVEIKGKGLFYIKNYERNLKKINALKDQNKKYIILFSDDDLLKKNYKKALRIHHENKTKKNNNL